MISLLELQRRIAAGLPPEAALEECRAAIHERDGELRAFTSVSPDAVFDKAGHGPLAGVAVGIKDIVDTADLPTEMGWAPIWGGWRPRADAALVSLIKAAGATIGGKTATTAFAHLDPAPTRNPHSAAHTPGGSSSGSAAAVAAGLVPLALGTQTGGSVIRPASFCGVAALKPSFRLLPTSGIKVQAWTLDTPGLFAATVADCAEALSAITGRNLRVAGAGASPPRIGIVRQEFAGPASAEAEAALALAAEAAARAGCRVIDLTLPDALARAWEIHPAIQNYEARVAHGWELQHRAAALPPLFGRALADAASLSVADYDTARGIARRARTAVRAVFAEAEVDVLLTYSAPGVAPLRDSTGDPRFNRLWTLLGVPCVNVPGLKTAAGLPVGLQVIAPFAGDTLALSAGALLENVFRDRPVISA